MIGPRAPAELWTQATAAEADQHTMGQLGIPSPLLMERAALCVAHEVAALRGQTGLKVVVLCGPGNNGGDGLAIARQLSGWEIPAHAVLCTDSPGASVREQRALCDGFGVTVVQGVQALSGPALWVDALLGTGSRGAPRGRVSDALTRQAGQQGLRVAVDIPTGVDPDTGHVHPDAFVADTTVTFVRSKPGLHVTPGRDHAGTVVVAEFGLWGRPDRDRAASLVDPGWVGRQVSRLPTASHKGQRGHVAVVGGSAGTPGAAVLAAAAALRTGAGLATIVSADSAVSAQLVAHRPEVMVVPPPTDGPVVPSAGALCVGPGLTAAQDQAAVVSLWDREPRAIVVDASALDRVPLHKAAAGPRVLTPHPGEAARLLQRAEPSAGWTSAQVQAQRVLAARQLVRHTGAVVVLKGAGTLVAWPSEPEPHVNVVVSGDPALATAGSGDVLAGIIAALLARGMTAPVAAAVGAHVHGLAGEALGAGAVAMDIADGVGAALSQVASPQGRRHPRWPSLRLG